MRYTTCLRCGRKLTNPTSQKRGYGPVCEYKAYVEARENQLNMSVAMDSAKHYDDFFVEYRKEGLINASKVFNRSRLKPTLRVNKHVNGSYGTFFHADRSIAIKVNYRQQHQKIATYIHELVHAMRFETGQFKNLDLIDGEYYNVPEEIIAELGEYIFFLRVGAFKNPESAKRFLSYQLWRINSIYLKKINDYKAASYISHLRTYYRMATRSLDQIMGEL